ncbi:hypothetical protein R1flu_026690 [Riccia fluitans]|uniref:Uncharacterized protein n=1 Tax=Riccia fluitans TaxID=41844 RepID=A0ABD1XGP5_9MARC
MSIGHGALPAAALWAEWAGERASGSTEQAGALRQPAAALHMAACRAASVLRVPAAALHATATLKRPRGRFRVREWERGREEGKSPELLEEGEFMPEVPAPPKKARPGPSDQEEKTARIIENAKMQHVWFVWFVFLVNLDECKRLYWTSNTDEGRERLVDKLIELAMDAFRKASQDPERFEFGRSLDEIQERLTKSVKSIPGHLLEQYEQWLKSSQFES